MKETVTMTSELAEHAQSSILETLKRPLSTTQTLTVWGDCVSSEWLVGVELTCSEDDVYYRQEVGFREEDDGSPRKDRFPLLLDAASALFIRFQDEHWLNPLPIEWREMPWAGVTIRVRAEFRRPKLEEMADAWLDKHGELEH